MKQALKIKLANHSDFKKAWSALIKLGYHWGANCTEPCTAPYLYTYEDGRILADYFDSEDADLSSPYSALGHFTNHKNKEITLDELIEISTRCEIWSKAPHEAWAWERFTNGKCVWHCRKDGKSFDKKAPNFKTERNTLWRDLNKQNEADQSNASINANLSKLNIVLA